MSTNHIVNCETKTLREIMTGTVALEIPDYQRPYAWIAEEHVARLFEDLYTEWKNDSSSEYFMGSVVFAGNPDDGKLLVIDGQQRLTTLLLMLAAGRSVCEETFSPPLKEIIFRSKGLPRLNVRQDDRQFFKDIMSGDERANGNDSQELMKSSFKWAQAFLEEDRFASSNDKVSFLDFILNRGVFVIVHALKESTALRMFQALNTTGLNLGNADLIKAWMLGLFDQAGELRSQYAAAWEQLSIAISSDAKHPNNAGRDASGEFESLLGCIRTFYTRRKQERGLYDEWTQRFGGPQSEFAPTEEDVCPVFDNVIQPFADAYRVIMKAEPSQTLSPGLDETTKQTMAAVLKWLNRVDFADWRLVVLAIFHAKVPAPQQAVFLTRFERLVAYLLLSNRRSGTRLTRYLAILREFDAWRGNGGTFVSNAVNLTKPEVEEFLRILNGNVYEEIKGNRVKYLFSRVNSFLAEDGAEIPFAGLSIEHVLPQNPKDDKNPNGPQWSCQEWNWTPEAREKWTHRFGNLIPLSLSRNQGATNFAFGHKKAVYLQGNNNTTATSAFLTRLLQKDKWTPEVVEENQRLLLETCTEKWDLHPEAAPVSIHAEEEEMTNGTKTTARKTGSRARNRHPQSIDPEVLSILHNALGAEEVTYVHGSDSKALVSFRTRTLDRFFPVQRPLGFGFYRYIIGYNYVASLVFHPGDRPSGCGDDDKERSRHEILESLPQPVRNNLIQFSAAKQSLVDGDPDTFGEWITAEKWRGSTDLLSVVQQIRDWENSIQTDESGSLIRSMKDVRG